MRQTVCLMMLGLFLVCGLSGCSNETYVIEKIERNQLSLGPDEQDPEASYALLEVTVDDQTTVDGQTNHLSDLQTGDIIRLTYQNDKKPLVATIERIK